MTQKLNTDNGLQGRTTRTTGYNTGLAKVAVQCSSATAETHLWLIKHWFSVSIRQLADGENRHLRQARKR
jgi:hypothetical protein